ncbi:hypothetical protein [Solitalea canadensis]|uniref:Uncharacterized protein n=1 Tax=Solitalea canadensis (strain ATCC 29591 / DSM 3403 / JCM 21819 / LMG 8368 / NBRC 15130 / NCIMB 12057 / USAM 9D) TaxID=929556 RepID=H8KL18_SOLCM|nr:hypothetical protein [Solitalea canadensis]AFD08835.1 hypothetical protein Solca_3837 [Solitalea canadensis DSM 3403]
MNNPSQNQISLEKQLAKMQKDLVRLKWYAGSLTLVFVAVFFLAFTDSGITRFKEISAERINIVESNGQLRMVIANKERSPEVLAYGKPLTPPIPGANRPGLVFYNDEGTENGGLVFMGGKDSTGKYHATGHLSFDQYNQNQVLYLTYSDENGAQKTGLNVDDWQTSPLFWDFRAEYKKAQKMPDSPKKDSLLKKLMEPTPGVKAVAQRVFVGKDVNKTAMVTLADRMGKPRLQMLVDSNGTAKLNFLDEHGKVTYSLPK